MAEKTTAEMLADIEAILNEDDDEEELPPEDAPVAAAPTALARPADASDTPPDMDAVEEAANHYASMIPYQLIQVIQDEFGNTTDIELLQDANTVSEGFNMSLGFPHLLFGHRHDELRHSETSPVDRLDRVNTIINNTRTRIGSILAGTLRRVIDVHEQPTGFDCDSDSNTQLISIDILLERMFNSRYPTAAVGSWNVLYDIEHERIPYDESGSSTASMGVLHIGLDEFGENYRFWGDVEIMRLVAEAYATHNTEENDEQED